MMNKDNFWLQRDGSFGRRVFLAWLQRDGSSAIKSPHPTGRRRLFSPLLTTKAGIHSRYQSKSRVFPHTQPHTMAILIVNVENNFYLCI